MSVTFVEAVPDFFVRAFVCAGSRSLHAQRRSRWFRGDQYWSASSEQLAVGDEDSEVFTPSLPEKEVDIEKIGRNFVS